MKIALAIGFMGIIVYVLGWLGSVIIVAFIQWLVNEIFATDFHFNIWLGGLLFYIIWLLFTK